MINFLSSWVKNLTLVLIIVSILEMILPNSKIKKYVKMVMGLYILFSIISPLIENSNKFSFDNFDFNFQVDNVEAISSSTESVNQISMDNRLNQIYKEQLQKDIIQKVTNEGYEVESCKVLAHISENDSGIESIVLKINSKSNVDDNEVQNKDTLENVIVKEIQKVQKVKVDVFESEQDSDNNYDYEKSNITKTDIKKIKSFLKKEYGVSEECLRIS